MKKITARLPETPWDAAYVAPVSKSGRILTVEYFNSVKHKLPHISHAAGVITEDIYMKMTAPLKEPKTNKAEADPIGKGQEKKMDKPYGRNVPEPEQAVIDLHKKKQQELSPDEKAPKNPITKRAKLTVGKGAGATKKQPDLKRPKGVRESLGDETTYTWAAIHEALAEIGQDSIARELMNALMGKEQVKMEGRKGKSFRDLRARLSEAENPADDFVYDPSAAQGEFQAELDGSGEKKKALVTVGMADDDVADKLVNLSKTYADDIENLDRSTKIRVIRFVNRKVDKILPTTLIKVRRDKSGEYVAQVSVTGKTVRLPLGDELINLKQAENGNFYYLDYGTVEEQPLQVKRH